MENHVVGAVTVFIWSSIIAVLALLGIVDQHATRMAATVLAQGTDANAYFDSLVARSEHWKSYSLRTPQQMQSVRNGGYAFCNSCPQDITYSPATDNDPHRQDAAKVVIPAFKAIAGSVLTQPLSATDTTVHLAAVSAVYIDRQLRIDDEIMTVPGTTRPLPFDRDARTVTVVRGQFGTRASSHENSSAVTLSANSIQNQIHLPLFTSDGHTYLFTWDVYYTDSWLNNGLANLKTFQFSSPSFPGGKANTVLFEVDNRFSDGRAYCTYAPQFDKRTDVSVVGFRSYNALGGDANWSDTDGNHMGPGVTTQNPACPVAGTFIVRPNRWTRYWVRVDQRANDYDYFDLWAADESTDPVKVYSRVPMSLRPMGNPANSIHMFWLEFNTSTNPYVRGSVRDFVTYVRNFVALRDVTDVDSVLIRPGADRRR